PGPLGAGARGGHLRRDAWPRTARHHGAVRHARAPQDDRRGGQRATRRGPRARVLGAARPPAGETRPPAGESLPELPPPLRAPRRAHGVVLRRHAPWSSLRHGRLPLRGRAYVPGPPATEGDDVPRGRPDP